MTYIENNTLTPIFSIVSNISTQWGNLCCRRNDNPRSSLIILFSITSANFSIIIALLNPSIAFIISARNFPLSATSG